MSDSAVRLVYFDIRGLAEPVRWMLKLAGQEFTDERIPLDAWAQKKKSSIESLKASRRKSLENNPRTKFIAQFPVLFVGDYFVSQPLTVMRYVARKYGFNGNNELEEARADEVSDLIYDLRLRAVEFEGTAFKSGTPDIVRHTVFRDLRAEADGPKKEKMKDDLKTMWFPIYFAKLTSLLDDGGGDYVAGATLTYGDLVLANFLDIAEDLLDTNCLAEFPKLKALKERVLSLPGIVEWKRSQELKQEEEGATAEQD